MFQVMAQTIRTATLMDVYDRTPPAAERAELARRQADALAAASRELQAEDQRRQAKARARAELKARARAAEALRADAARRPAPLFGRRAPRLSLGFRFGTKAA